MPSSYCTAIVLGYEDVASRMADDDISLHLNTFGDMIPSLWADPMYRKWRRCVMVEALKRGLIVSDTGHKKPERRY